MLIQDHANMEPNALKKMCTFQHDNVEHDADEDFDESFDESDYNEHNEERMVRTSTPK